MFIILSTILQGALTGLIVGISLALWMAFGGPKPPLPVLSTSVEECEINRFYITKAINLNSTLSQGPAAYER